MKKICFLTVICLFTITSAAIAQTYEVPKDYSLKTKEDYAKYEPDVINTIDWLQQTSWDEQPDKRKEANTFFVAWITGSPNVSIEIGVAITKLADKNKELLITYMGGFTKYTLQHKEAQNVIKAKAAGIKALIDKYQSEKSHRHDGAVEKMIKISSDDKLEDWVKTNFTN